MKRITFGLAVAGLLVACACFVAAGLGSESAALTTMVAMSAAPMAEDVLENIHTEIKGFADGVTGLRDEIGKVGKRMDDVERKLNRSRFGGGGADNPADIAAELKAIGAFVRSGNDTELKAMSVGIDNEGGYWVLPATSSGMTKKLFDQTPMRRIARIETITAGDRWEEPFDISDIEAVWVGEKQDRPATDTAGVGLFKVPVVEIYANQPVTQRLLDDSGFDIGAWVDGKCTDKFARSEGSAFVSGNAIQRPKGFLSYPRAATSDASRAWGELQFVPSGLATEINADSLRALVWSLRAPYRQGATWLMNSNTASKLDQLKTGDGQYIWRPGMTAGAPNILLGYPVEFSEDMPDVEADALPIAFGNWKLGYVIVDKTGIKFLRDPYTNKPNVMFYAYKRVGGAVANFEAIKLLRVGVN